MSFRRHTCTSCGSVLSYQGGPGGKETDLNNLSCASVSEACLRLRAHVSFLRRKSQLTAHFCAKMLSCLAVVENVAVRLAMPISSDYSEDKGSCPNEIPSMTSSDELEADLAFDNLVGPASPNPKGDKSDG